MLSGDDKVVLLDEGPFKLEASCKKIVHEYHYHGYDDDYYNYTSSYSTMSDTSMMDDSYYGSYEMSIVSEACLPDE